LQRCVLHSCKVLFYHLVIDVVGSLGYNMTRDKRVIAPVYRVLSFSNQCLPFITPIDYIDRQIFLLNFMDYMYLWPTYQWEARWVIS
jgi:hypothetical protein